MMNVKVIYPCSECDGDITVVLPYWEVADFAGTLDEEVLCSACDARANPQGSSPQK
jgi:hypothetical protein